MILSDGALGQMMEKVVFEPYAVEEHIYRKDWATTGKSSSRDRNIITSLHIQPEKMEEINRKLQAKYSFMNEEEVRFENHLVEDAQLLVVAYGLAARICQRAVDTARSRGIPAGLLRPKTLYPFPHAAIRQLLGRQKGVLVVEMNAGQMVEDVRLAVNGDVPVDFYGRTGGVIPTPEEVLNQVLKFSQQLGLSENEEEPRARTLAQ
jgi:2-oxoglutarate ferredoxin oxidoreductase subunit alpha